MTTSLLSLDRISVIAHRGGSKLRPENTMQAFDHAVSLGVDAIECDVHLSRDRDVVVIHDAALERTTDASGPVSAHTADELARVDAGHHFGPDIGFPCRGVGGIPRLSHVIERHTDIPIIIEIKGDDPEVVPTVLGIVSDARAADRVIIGGFSLRVLRAVRRLAPEIPTGASREEVESALRRSIFRLAPRPSGYRLFQAPYRLRGKQVMTQSFVRAARRAGFPVQAWIVDEAGDMQRIIEWGVTGITSDRPDVAIEVVRAHGSAVQPVARRQ
jgi:glycerophosphoryl diester phosphodiesterase